MSITAGKTADQIARIDAKDCFLEIRSSLFDAKSAGKVGKVMFNFVKYDNKTNKALLSIATFIDIPRVLELTDQIRLHFIDQDIKREIARAQQNHDQYCNNIWIDFGGTSARTLASRGKARQDGKSESRTLEIVPANKEGHVMIRAKRGPGIEQDNGTIKPDYTGGAKFDQLGVVVSMQDLRAAAKLIDINITAFETRKWMNGCHDYIYEASNSNAGHNTPQNTSDGYYPMAPQNRINNQQNNYQQGQTTQNQGQQNYNQQASQPQTSQPQAQNPRPVPVNQNYMQQSFNQQGYNNVPQQQSQQPPMSAPASLSPAGQGFETFTAPTDEELSDAGFFPMAQAQ